MLDRISYQAMGGILCVYYLLLFFGGWLCVEAVHLGKRVLANRSVLIALSLVALVAMPVWMLVTWLASVPFALYDFYFGRGHGA